MLNVIYQNKTKQNKIEMESARSEYERKIHHLASQVQALRDKNLKLETSKEQSQDYKVCSDTRI